MHTLDKKPGIIKVSFSIKQRSIWGFNALRWKRHAGIVASKYHLVIL